MSDHPLGLVIYASVKPIFKIYFIIGGGYYFAKKNVLSVTTCRDISDFVIRAILPCLIFENVVINLKSSDIKNVGILFFTGVLLFFTGTMLAILTHIVTKSPKRWLGGLISVGLFPNISDLPIAYLQTLSKGNVVFTPDQGSKGVAYVCIFLASQVVFQFCLGLYRLVEWDFRDELKEPPKDEELATSDNDDKERESIKSEDHPNIENTSIASSYEEPIASGSSRIDQNINSQELLQHNEFLKARELRKSLSNSRSLHSEDDAISTGRYRRSSINSSNTNAYSLTQVRTTDLRKQRTQDMNDIINEYSEFESLKYQEIQKLPSGIIDGSAASVIPVIEKQKEQGQMTSLKSLFLLIKTSIKQSGKNFLAPNSLALIISFAIAMSPPLKALFVPTNYGIPNAPDGQPPLSFIIDLTTYVGAASVPLGLTLLGATISRLQVKSMPPGFWKTALMITLSRLVILPIIGVGITTGFYKAGWYGDDIVVRFVSVLEFGLPSATSLVYFTAFYTDPNSDDHLQMDCLAVCLIFQYAILFISLPFLVTFTFKVSFGY